MLTWAIQKVTVQLSDQRSKMISLYYKKKKQHIFGLYVTQFIKWTVRKRRGVAYFVTEHFNLAVPTVYRFLSGVFVRVDLDVKRQALDKRDIAYIIDRNLLESTSTSIKDGNNYITKCRVLILKQLPTLTPFWLLKSVLRQWTATFTWEKKGNRYFIFQFIQAGKSNDKSTFNLLSHSIFVSHLKPK